MIAQSERPAGLSNVSAPLSLNLYRINGILLQVSKCGECIEVHPVPHGCFLPAGLPVGSTLYIQGVCSVSFSGATFNLQRGPGEEADICFHLDARPSDDKVVRNSRLAGEWGSEEKGGGCPFVAGEPFLLVIATLANNYQVDINGKKFTTFKHREGLLSPTVTNLLVFGDVMLQAVHLPLENLPQSLRLTVPGNVKVGDQFSIKGVPKDGAGRFVMNWQCGPNPTDDVMYHMSVRFEGKNKVIRNSRLGEDWGSEEKEGAFPFVPGEPFHIQVSVGSGGFLVRTNGIEHFFYAHRMDFRRANVLVVDGTVQITDFTVDSPKGKLLHEGSYRDFAGSALEVFYPASPSALIIPGGLAPGKFIAVSGKVDPEPSRMYVNLQCAECEEADCSIHLNPRFETKNFVVLNSKDGDWQDEMRVEDSLFVPGCNFDLTALVEDDGYQLAVNGAPLTKFPARMDVSRAHHIAIGGSATFSRILVF